MSWMGYRRSFEKTKSPLGKAPRFLEDSLDTAGAFLTISFATYDAGVVGPVRAAFRKWNSVIDLSAIALGDELIA